MTPHFLQEDFGTASTGARLHAELQSPTRLLAIPSPSTY